MPLLVAQFEYRCARPVPGAVDQQVDTRPLLLRQIDQALQIVVGLDGTGNPDSIQFLGQRIALAPEILLDNDLTQGRVVA